MSSRRTIFQPRSLVTLTLVTLGVAIVGIASLAFVLSWQHAANVRPHWTAFASLANIGSYFKCSNGLLPLATATDVHSGESSTWRVEVYQTHVLHGFIEPRGTDDKVSMDYNYHKPWNDPANLRLQSYGVLLFNYEPLGVRSPPIAADDYSTYFKAITGPGTAFDPATRRSLGELPNDLIVVARVERSDTHWMEPGDLNIEQLAASEEGKRLLLGRNGYAVLFADCMPWVLSGRLPFSDLCKFMTIAGAEQYDRDAVLAPYRILP